MRFFLGGQQRAKTPAEEEHKNLSDPCADKRVYGVS
jgi:hypothetical protein